MLHGGDIYGMSYKTGLKPEELLDFSANINPLGLPDSVERAIHESIAHLIHYPDPNCRKLTEAIAGMEGVKEDFVLCGNGAADLIYRFVLALNPKLAWIPVPTFLEYEEALSSVGTKIVHYNMDAELRIREDFLDGFTDDLDVVFLCNPNNPTGFITEPALLHRILEKAKKTNTILFLDECFMDFVEKSEDFSLKKEVAETKNLFLLRSFTKMYGIAGLRLGYALSSDIAFLEKMQQAGPPWSVNTLAQAAGIAALGEHRFPEKTRAYIAEGKQYLETEMKKLGISIYPGEANYILFQVDGREDLKYLLAEKNIMIRSCDNYPNLTKEFYRIGIKGENENKRLIQALQEVL